VATQLMQRPRLKVRLIGELELIDDGRALSLPASRKTRALFVYLRREPHDWSLTATSP
jgi:hypothetical protein